MAIRVVGYHGTSIARAQEILRDGVHPSDNWYDWLGPGIYLFQDAPLRAWAFAAKHHGTANAAVIGVGVELADCLDLLDIGWIGALKSAFQILRESGATSTPPLRAQRPGPRGGPHGLDRAVVKLVIATLWRRDRKRIRCVRGAFEEGRRLYPRSAFRELTHVQIVVRHTSLIVNRWLESRPGVTS
jgi:hypothetical protein